MRTDMALYIIFPFFRNGIPQPTNFSQYKIVLCKRCYIIWDFFPYKMSDNNEKITYIIPHTHWDREWYVPFQYFRFRLVEMIDDLIQYFEDNPEFKYFSMDGQTIVLDDYLEIKPHNRAKIQKLIDEKKIGIGPWYLACSPWLQTGEGLIRNLIEGHAMCKDYNTTPINIGWIPDQFIHPIQLPQILQGFGLDHMAFSRGMANQLIENPNMKSEFTWKALDGSEVTAFHLQHGYGTMANLNKDPMIALNALAMDMGQGFNAMPWSTNIQLAFTGSDHSGVSHAILDAVEMFNEEEDLTEDFGTLKLSSWEEYLHDFHKLNPQLETYSGEISGRRYVISLHDVFSSYMPIKQRSFLLHDMYERWSEPFSALAFMQGLPTMEGYLRTGWKWLLKNQAHDSSWTSSVDQVQKEMETRFDWSDQIATDVYRRSLQWTVQHIQAQQDKDTIPIVIFNPHTWKRTDLVQVRFSNKFGAFQIINTDGKEIIFQQQEIIKGDKERDQRRVFVPSQGSLGSKFIEATFVAEDIPALGYKTYLIKKRDPAVELALPEEGLLDGNDYYLENDVLRVIIEENGSISIMHRETIPENEKRDSVEVMGEEIIAGSIWAEDKFYTHKNLHAFKDEADVGDGWEFIGLKEDITSNINSFGELVKIELLEASDFRGIIKMDKILKVPSNLTEDLKNRQDNLVEIPITTYISIRKGNDPIIRFKTILTNNAKDHRLRLLFPTKFTTNEINVNGHFGITTRKITLPDGKGWFKFPQSTQPFQKWLSIWDENQKHGLAILSKGLPEYAAKYQNEEEKKDVSIELTLLRSTGGWGRHINRKPPIDTPLAQLYEKEMIFEYALVPLSNKWNANLDTLKETEQRPLYQIADEYYTELKWEENYDTYNYNIPKTTNECNFPNEAGFLQITPANVILSSFKQSGFEIEQKYVIVRVYNILQESTLTELTFGFEVKQVKFVDLKEDLLEEQPEYAFNQEKRSISFKLGAAKIQTLKIFY